MWINYTRRIITLICCSFSYPCIFCFSDLFLPVPRKVNLFLTKMVFEGRATTQTKNAKVTKKKTIFCFKKVFFCQPFFEKIQGLGFPKENLCRGPPFKNFGKGYQVRKLVYLPFHPFSQKRGREGIPG